MPSVAIMQPYVFPYLGYFQLIRAVDHFVFYDDVQYIRRGWINRNRLSDKGRDTLFTVPVVSAAREAAICEVITGADSRWLKKFGQQLRHEYGKAPFFGPVSDLVHSTFEDSAGVPVSELAIRSVTRVMDYLDLPLEPIRSSQRFPRVEGRRGAVRLIDITRALGGETYINPPGGVDLYTDEMFAPHGVRLAFIRDLSGPYPQFGHPFLPRLSIIDVLMHNAPDRVRTLMGQCDLVPRVELLAGRPAPSTAPNTD